MTASTLLVCPVCREALSDAPGAVTCTGCARTYPVHEDVPYLFPDADADPTGGAGPLRRLYHSVLADPRLYDPLQRYGGGVPISREVGKTLADTGGATVLDVGAGTGMVADVIPDSATYIWLDNDPLKLGGFRRKRRDTVAVLADATRLPLRDGAVDVVTIVEVAHHLPDEALRAFLDEAARVTRGRVVLVDGLRTARLRSRLLWSLDLGRHPRTRAELEASFADRFLVRAQHEFRVNHDHVIFDLEPQREAEHAT